MNRKYEEGLEAIYTSGEKDYHSLAKIKEQCHIEVDDDLLVSMEKEDLIIINGSDVLFTQNGTREATRLIRRHRLAESLLASAMQTDHKRMEEIACEFEHAIYPEIEESICTLLGHPTHCPHDREIPQGECCKNQVTTIEQKVKTLSDLAVGQSGRVTYFKTDDTSKLVKLQQLGIRKGVVLGVQQKYPTLVVSYEDQEVAMDQTVGEDIYLVQTKS
mgnify:FL=1